MHDFASDCCQLVSRHAPSLRGNAYQLLTGSGCRTPQYRSHVRGSHAPKRPHVKGSQLRIAHHHPHPAWLHLKLFRHRLSQRSSYALTYFNLAGEDCDAVICYAEPCVDGIGKLHHPIGTSRRSLGCFLALRSLRHGATASASSSFSAASSTALRIRSYAPQRQI